MIDVFPENSIDDKFEELGRGEKGIQQRFFWVLKRKELKNGHFTSSSELGSTMFRYCKTVCLPALSKGRSVVAQGLMWYEVFELGTAGFSDTEIKVAVRHMQKNTFYNPLLQRRTLRHIFPKLINEGGSKALRCRVSLKSPCR